MDTDTRDLILDHALNWLLFTPCIVSFWYGTYLLQDAFLFNLIESRIIGVLLLFAFGVSIEVSITVWQDEIAAYVCQSSNTKYFILTRLYNFIVSSANIGHYRVIHELYDCLYGPSNFPAAVQSTVTSIIVLWSLRASRNITSTPFTLSLDTNHSDWFKAPTLYGVQYVRKYGYLGDVFMTVLVVWSLAPLHWVSLSYVFDHIVFPNHFSLSASVSVALGYAIVALFSYYQQHAVQWSVFYDGQNRWISKTALENIFIWGATAGVILSWKGLGMLIDAVAVSHPCILFATDCTGLATTLVPFGLLSLCHVSGCLVAKGAEMDGRGFGGGGVDFSRAYCKHVFQQLKETIGKKAN